MTPGLRWVGFAIVVLAIAGCGRTSSVGVPAAPAGSASAPSVSSSSVPPLDPPMSAQSMALERAFVSTDDRVSGAVDVRGSFHLAQPLAGSRAAVSREQALGVAAQQPALAALDPSASAAAQSKLALASKAAPGASNLPLGADTTQRLAWVILVARVPDPAGGPSHGVPAPGVTTTTPLSASLVDVVATVDALTGEALATYIVG